MPPRWFPCGASGGSSFPTAISFVAASTLQAAAATSTIPWPTGIKNGDYVFGVISNAAGGSVSPTNGMARLYGLVTTGTFTYVFDHVYHSGDDPSGITFSGLNAGGSGIGMGAWRGCNYNWDLSSSFSQIWQFTGSTTPTSQTNTTRINGSVGILFTIINAGVNTITPAAGYTQRVTLAPTAAFGGLEIDDKAIPSAGLQAAAHVTLGSAASSSTGLIAFAHN